MANVTVKSPEIPANDPNQGYGGAMAMVTTLFFMWASPDRQAAST